MKSLSIAALALVLALSGCSSSPSIEEQTKLVQYQKCLEEYSKRQSDWRGANLKYLERLTYLSGTERLTRWTELIFSETESEFSATLKNCSKYRP